jgi:hypothetical protein
MIKCEPYAGVFIEVELPPRRNDTAPTPGFDEKAFMCSIAGAIYRANNPYKEATAQPAMIPSTVIELGFWLIVAAVLFASALWRKLRG